VQRLSAPDPAAGKLPKSLPHQKTLSFFMIDSTVKRISPPQLGQPAALAPWPSKKLHDLQM